MIWNIESKKQDDDVSDKIIHSVVYIYVDTWKNIATSLLT